MNSAETRRFDLAFDEPLTDRAAGGFAERVKCERVARLMREWQRYRERTASADPLSPADAFFRGLEAIAQQTGNGVLDFIDRWSVSYFVSRKYEDGVEEERAYARLAMDLLYLTLPNGNSPLAGLKFATPVEQDGSLLALAPGGRLFIRGVTGSTGRLHWSCSGREASVTNGSDPLRNFQLDLPLLAADTVMARFTPNAVANGFQIPILDDGAAVLLTRGYSPDHEGTQPSIDATPHRPLSLAESLGKAHDVLESVWPEVIPWVRALVPAIADMGPRNPRAARLSGSFGPGEPIYLSQVTNPLLHAEDLIHEVQHLRFALTVPAEEWFGRWRDDESVFISPYRPDLRPIAGIHLGLHAFVAVTEFGLRTIEKPTHGKVSLNWLHETHLRNLFAFHTIANHEELSSDGKSYYREVGHVLATQHDRIGALVAPAQQEEILSSLGWPIRPEGEAAANASIDIRRVALTSEIAGLIPSEFGR
jgi:HEXXH motif-containing protein